MKIFGFELTRPKDEIQLPAIVPQVHDDGAVQIAGAGGVYGTYLDQDGSVRSEAELINKYREMAEHPEVEAAVDDVVNESIIIDEVQKTVEIDLDELEVDDGIKDAMVFEFKNILTLLEFATHPYEIFKRWYVDGRLYYQIIIDPKDTEAGIQELRYIDPRKIRKIREIETTKDLAGSGYPTVQTKAEYYLYNEKGLTTSAGSSTGISSASGPGVSTGVRIAKDSILHCTCGLASAKGDIILSYLHKAIKALNQLKNLEDSLVIYRLSRAPERRIFYIDIGNLPKMKAEQYLRDVMVRFKNKIVYDAGDGSIRDDRKFMTMLEDFWLPRREGGRGTEITTLPGGQNLGQIEDIVFFQRKLFRSLNVPITRLDPEAMFNYGRSNEITRDEIKFSKFIDRLRMKFAILFTKALRTQLVLKNVMTQEEFDSVIQKIKYKFAHDSYFEELKNSEIMQERMALLMAVQPNVGKYVSNMWVRKKILMQTDEEIKEEDKEIKAEYDDPQYYPPMLPDMGGPSGASLNAMSMGGPQGQLPIVPPKKSGSKNLGGSKKS